MSATIWRVRPRRRAQYTDGSTLERDEKRVGDDLVPDLVQLEGDGAGWRVAFSRAGEGVTMSSLAGETVDNATAANLAASITGFLT